jgi:hypothetical protein
MAQVIHETEFCPHCGCERRIVEDKPWLPSVCRACGRNV